MHSVSIAYNSPNITNSIAHVAINAIGNMGVTLFILISGFFGIRLRVSKVWWLWSLMLFYSLLLFSIQYFLKETPPIGNEHTKEFLKQLYVAFTPATSGTWWFCTSYLIVLVLSPFFNKLSEIISKRQFQYLLAVLITIYSLAPTFLMHSLSNTPNGKCTENMILAYLIGRYFYFYGIPKLIRNNAVTIFTFCFCIIFFVDYFLFDPLFLCKDHSFFIILGAICIFHFFGIISISSDKASRIIRYAAGYVFPFYLLNVFLIAHLEFQYAALASSSMLLLFLLLLQGELIIISFAIEFFRRILFGQLVNHISNFLDMKFHFDKHNIFSDNRPKGG